MRRRRCGGRRGGAVVALLIAIVAGLLLASPASAGVLPATASGAATGSGEDAEAVAEDEGAADEGAGEDAEAVGADEGETLNVRLRVDETREDVPGVTVRVLQDGAEVAAQETDESGVASFTVPEAGAYEVEVDLSTLPPDLAELGLEQNPFPTVVSAGTPRTVAFRLSEGVGDGDGAGAGGGRDSSIAFGTTPQLVAQGLRFGLILALAAIGLSLVFGTTGLTNFSHGELITFGALTAYGLNVVADLHLLVAAPLTVLLAAGFGWLQDTVLWRQLRRRGAGLIAMMIISIGLSFLLRFTYLYLADGTTKLYGDFAGQSGTDLFGNGSVVLRPSDLVTMAIATTILVLVGLALLYTRIGKATRAVSDNPALAAASGIDVDGVIRVVWVVGTALAGLGGILLTLTQGSNYLTGFQILLLVFAAVILGGLGTAFGAMFGALVVGVFIEVSTLVVPTELKNVGALAILILILLVRPQGILGRRERVG